jgi:hypothetical protein
MTDVTLIFVLVLNISVLHLSRTTKKPQSPTLSTPKKEFEAATYGMGRHNIAYEITPTTLHMN